jgi:hypothetical protein
MRFLKSGMMEYGNNGMVEKGRMGCFERLENR